MSAEDTLSIRLWLVKETDKARQYCKFAPHPDVGFSNADKTDFIWIPRSIVEHTSKRGIEHVVRLPVWFVNKNRL